MHTDVLRWAGEWRRSTDCALESPAELGERFKLIRFEDLTGDPGARCRELCEWANVRAAVDEMTALHDSGAGSSFDDKGEAKKGAVRDLSGRRRENLSEPEMEAIRAVCGPRARVFGYDLGPRPEGVSPFADQHAALARLTMKEYARFLPSELRRRAVRALKTGYSLLTGKRTQSRW